MSHILTVIIDVDSEQKISVSLFESDGTTDKLALAAIQAVERTLQRRIVRTELEAEAKKTAESDDGP